MVVESNWQKMKTYAVEVIRRDGGMSVQELESIVEIGCADGELDEYEKVVLINIISNLTRADMCNAMWDKVDELMEKFDLHHDDEAVIEDLDDENNET